MKSRIFQVFVIFLLSLFSIQVYAQEARGSLGGVVEDTTGAVIPGAVVAVTSVETGVTRSTRTGASGTWVVNFLNPGRYTFTVSAESFRKLEHSAVQLQVNDQIRIDVKLEVGERTSTVVVSSQTPLINTTSAVSGTVISGEQLLETPNESNIPTMLAALAPSIVVGGAEGQTVAHLVQQFRIRDHRECRWSREHQCQLHAGWRQQHIGQWRHFVCSALGLCCRVPCDHERL